MVSWNIDLIQISPTRDTGVVKMLLSNLCRVLLFSQINFKINHSRETSCEDVIDVEGRGFCFLKDLFGDKQQKD